MDGWMKKEWVVERINVTVIFSQPLVEVAENFVHFASPARSLGM